MRAPSPYPPFRETLRRAVLAVGGSLSILLLSLLFVGALWLALVAIGLEVFSPTFVQSMASPPLSSFFVDIFVPVQIFGLTTAAIVVTVVITLVRALVWAALTGMILESLEFGSVSMVGVLQGIRAYPAVLVFTLVNVLAIVFSNLVLPALLGPIGQLALAAILFGSLYFLPFTAAAAVRGPLPAREAMRRSARAARLPGARHIAMVILYFFVFILLSAAIPGRSQVTANPSLAEWAWVLGGTVVHVLFLAMFCQRWVVVEHLVPAGPAPRAAARSSARRR
jgi:hypothetical protein